MRVTGQAVGEQNGAVFIKCLSEALIPILNTRHVYHVLVFCFVFGLLGK